MNDSNHQTRRDVLKGLTWTAAAAGVAGPLAMDLRGESASSPASGPASAPAAGSSQAKPVWLVGCRDAHVHDLGLPHTWAGLKAIEAECTEVRVDEDYNCVFLKDGDEKYSLATAEGVRKVQDRFAAEGLRISAFCLSNRFDDRPAAEEIAFIMKVVDACVAMNVPAIRLDVVPHRLRGQDDAFLKVAIDVGRQLIQATEHTNVRFGVENHGGTTNKVELLLAMFEGIGSKRFGSTLDVANFYWFGYPLSRLYEIYATFAPWACHTHCKSIAYPPEEREKQREVGWEYGKYCTPIHLGDIDFARLARILDDAGYTGDLCIENESLGRFPKEQRASILKHEITLLKEVAAAVGRRPR